MKISIFIFTLFFIIACTKIQPINNNISNKNINSTSEIINENKWKIACWIISCDYKSYINETYWKIDKIDELDTYQKRLSILLKQYTDASKLIKSKEFEIFTNDLYLKYFWCKWSVYNCDNNKNNKYTDDELNYIFYIFIPKIVIDEYVIKMWWDEQIAENIIQAIKRKDFKTNIFRDVKLKIYKEKLEKYISKIDLTKVDVEKLLIDNYYFYDLILKPNSWLHDKILNQSVNAKWFDWAHWEQLKTITSITTDSFYKKISTLWISKNLFKQKIIEIYWYNSNKDIINQIKEDLNKKMSIMEKKYNLKKTTLSNRYFRNDELYVLNKDNYQKTLENISWWGNNLNDYYNDISEIWSKVLLIFNLWVEQEYYYLPKRLQLYNNENTFLITNTFKIYKYIEKYNYNPNFTINP